MKKLRNIKDENSRGLLLDVHPQHLDELNNEIAYARAKFSGNTFLLAALMEEVGELAQAYIQGQPITNIRREALQCACVAMRIYEEGDDAFDKVDFNKG